MNACISISQPLCERCTRANLPIFLTQVSSQKLSGFQRYPNNEWTNRINWSISIEIEETRIRCKKRRSKSSKMAVIWNLEKQHATTNLTIGSRCALVLHRALHLLPPPLPSCPLPMIVRKYTRTNEEKWKKRAIKNRSEDYALLSSVIRCSSSIHGWLLIKRALSIFEAIHEHTRSLTIDSAGQAHQNGCDMTRNIPQPIWCIGPQKVFSFRCCILDTTFLSLSLSFSLSLSRSLSLSPICTMSPFRVVPPLRIAHFPFFQRYVCSHPSLR